MINAKIKKWGNSMGLLIPKKEIEALHIKEDQEVLIDIIKKQNPLKEMFGFGKRDKNTRDEIRELRALLDSRF